MKTVVLTLLWVMCIACMPCLAAEAPFNIAFRQQNVVQEEVTTKADLLLSVTNQCGTDAYNVSVSAVQENSFLVINIPIPFGDIPNGAQKEILIQAVVPNLSISENPGAEEVVWQVEYTPANGEAATIEVTSVKDL